VEDQHRSCTSSHQPPATSTGITKTMRKYDCIYLVIIAVTAYVIATIFVFTQCFNQLHPQPNGSDTDIATALRSFPLSSAQLCDETKLEEYFKLRFLEEVQNLVNGNETEFVTKMKMAQSQMVTNEIEIKLRASKEEFQSKLSSLQASNQQQILDMKKRYEEHGKSNVLLPKDRVGNYFANLARVSRDSFNQTFAAQFGYEFLESYSGSQDLLLLYTLVMRQQQTTFHPLETMVVTEMETVEPT
jgi:hypothetical protein